MPIKAFLQLLKATGQAWGEDRTAAIAAALAYHTIFSIAPMLFIAIAIADSVLGKKASEGQLVGQIAQFVGDDAAHTIQFLIGNISQQGSGLATILSSLALIWAASNLFGQLKLSLNTIWHVDPKKLIGFFPFLWHRIVAITMVIVVGLLLTMSLITVTLVTALQDMLIDIVPKLVVGLPLLDLGLSLLFMTLVFAAIYRFVPNIKISFNDVILGAALTALLFTLGKYLIGLYLANASYQSTYGAAGSLVVLLVWIYFSAQILLFGAEFTKIYTRTYGSHRPRPHYVRALDAVTAITGEEPWPTLAIATAANPTQTTFFHTYLTWLLALVAFIAGMIVGKHRK